MREHPQGARVDVGRAVRCLFRQRDWARTLFMGMLFMFIPMVGPIAFQGYAVRVFKHLVLTGDDANLPPLEGFTDLMNLGFTPFIVSMIYTFPLVFLVYAAVGIGVLAGFLVVAGIAMALAALGMDPEITAVLSIAAAALVGLLVFVLIYAIILLVSYPLQAVHTLVELTGKPEYAWRIKEVLGYMRALKPEYRRAFIGMLLYNALIMGVGMLLCYIGFFPATVVMAVAGAHLRAQLYRIYLATGHAALAMDPRL
jgi:hypothetical protein